eukprot:gene17109-20379_t
MEPRPHRSTKIEEFVKGKLRGKIGKLLNNEEMEKEGRAIEKGATAYEDNLVKAQKRVRKQIQIATAGSSSSQDLSRYIQ